VIKKLINGDYGLAKTFWLGGVLVNAILGPLMMTLSVLLPREINDKTLLMLTLLSLAAVGIIYFLTIAWSIWMAANKYSGWDGWALAAKTCVVLGVLNTGFATFSGL